MATDVITTDDHNWQLVVSAPVVEDGVKMYAEKCVPGVGVIKNLYVNFLLRTEMYGRIVMKHHGIDIVAEGLHTSFSC